MPASAGSPICFNQVASGQFPANPPATPYTTANLFRSVANSFGEVQT